MTTNIINKYVAPDYKKYYNNTNKFTLTDYEKILDLNLTYHDIKDYVEHPYDNLNNPIYDLDTIVRHYLANLYRQQIA